MSVAPPLKILLLVHSFNSLSQRLFVELQQSGHLVSVEFDINDSVTIEAVTLFQPDLIIAPFLKRPIPHAVWSRLPCLILHPGPPGDRGPAALDWAILNQQTEWGVTLLQANDQMDGGDVWGYELFPMRLAEKSSLYRLEVTEAASRLVHRAIEQFGDRDFSPQPQCEIAISKQYQAHHWPSQQERSIDWIRDDRQTVLSKIHAADGTPGLLDTIADREFHLYDAHPAVEMGGEPGSIVAHSGTAICRATTDGHGVWIGQLREEKGPHPFKLPATQLLADLLTGVPEVENGYCEIECQIREGIVLLHFPFYNGTMSTARCRRLQQQLQQLKQRREIKAILLLGGPHYWSNGMDLNQIEASKSPADASWENIQALDDLALEIIETTDQLTISVLQGNAAAGGVFLARAADLIWARRGVILNPHYKDMGNLHGSEYWSYLLPRHIGDEQAERLIETRLPMGTAEAVELGLVDADYPLPHKPFLEHCIEQAHQLIDQPNFAQRLEEKRSQRVQDEAQRPLSSYRDAELKQMQMNFYGFDPSYHIARYNFVHKVPKSRTPLNLATHRRLTTR